jgi:hypothetical protein
MSRQMKYAVTGALCAVALGLLGWYLLVGHPAASAHPAKASTSILAVTTAIATALLAGRSGKGCRWRRQDRERHS